MMCTEWWVSEYPCAILVPQCPEQMAWSSALTPDCDLTDLLLQMIDDALEDSRIDPRRIYLSGYSLGGSGSWYLAAQAPERFAAVVPIAGGARPDLADALRDVPIWAIHSSDDQVVTVDGTRQIIDAIREIGGDPNYTELTSAGHRAWPEAFHRGSPVLTWMFEQRLADPH